MKAEKDKKTGKWLIQYRYTDWCRTRAWADSLCTRGADLKPSI